MNSSQLKSRNSGGQSTVADRLLRHPLVLATCLGVIAGACVAFIGASISPLLGIAGVAALGVTVCFLRFPTSALYILAFAVPIERFGRISDDTSAFSLSVTRGVGFLALVALVPVLVMRRKAPFVNGALWLWSAFTAVGLLTLTYTSDFSEGQRIASGYIGNILFLFTIMNLTMSDRIEESRRRVNTAILCWLLASAAVAAYSIWDWHFGSGKSGGIPISELDPQAGAQLAQYRWSTVWIDTAEKDTLGGLSIRRSMGSASHAAVFGINLIMSIPFFMYMIPRAGGRFMQGLLLAGLGATLYCVLLTNTRATLVVAAGAVGLCAMFRLIRVSPLVVLGGVLAMAISPLFLPVDIIERVLDWRNYSTSKSTAMQVRLDLWAAGLRAISDHWLMGNGLANQRVVLDYLPNFVEGRSHMHNIFLQTLMDVGVFGWMLFLGFLSAVVYTCTKARRIFLALGDREDADMLSASLVLVVCVLVYGMQVDVLYFPLKAWWLIIGLVFVMGRHARLAAGKARETIAQAS